MKKTLIASLVFSLSGVAHAALHDRGDGLVYDDVLNITWTQRTGGSGTGLGTTGQGILSCMECYNGTSTDNSPTRIWNGIETTGWRLPKRLSGNTPSTSSELGYMFIVNLGLTGAHVPGGNKVDITTANGVTIFDVTEDVYWMAEEWETPNGYGFLWSFEIDRSPQLDPLYQNNYGALWYVRDGDVAAIPEPSTYAMMLAGLGLVGLAARRYR